MPKVWPFLLALVLAAGVALSVGTAVLDDAEPVAFPFPVPIYGIEAVSGNHHASLLNLPLPYVGAPQVPIPVDVNGDLLPDVTASVNLIDPEGVFNNPPAIAELIAPNVEIRRLLTAPILGQSNPPLRINVKLTLVDLQGEQGPTVVRFGYDTGLGGSIPTDFKAIVGGLADFFNPLVATVDTTGGFLGLDPGLPDLGLGPVGASYSGPLTLIGGLESDVADADLGLAFDPLPSRLEVTYGTDGEHQNITYAHASPREVDVTTTANLDVDGTLTDVTARVDRLPRQMAVDVALGTGGTGSLDYNAASDGRLPDIAVDLARHTPDTPDEAPMIGRFEIEALPDAVHADWSIVPGGGGAAVNFDSSGAGIGALGARIATYDGASAVVSPWVPTEEQFIHLATGPEGFAGDTLIEARLERIRSASFTKAEAGGVEADIDVGDGEQALVAHVDADMRAAETPGPKVELTTTIAPLPDHIGFTYQPSGEPDAPQPLVATYESSESVDIDAHVEVALKDTPLDVECGDIHTICGDLALRNLPTDLRVAVDADPEPGGRTVVDLDTTPGPGAALPDVHADLVLGNLADDAVEGDRAMYIQGDVLGLPRSATVLMVQDPEDEALQEVRFRACDVDEDTDACTEETEDGNIGEIRFQVSNFAEDERPDDLLAPQAIAPTWATITARGLDTPADGMLFEAAGRVTDVQELRYVDLAGVKAVRAHLGQGEDFAARVDMVGIDKPDDEPNVGRVDTYAEALLQPLPQEIEFCFGGGGRDLVDAPTDELTADCEPLDPFEDGSQETLPLVIDYEGDVEFDTEGSFSTTTHRIPELILDDSTMSATFDVDGVPQALNAQISTPPADTEGPVRVLTDASDTIDQVDLSFAMTTAGADCDDPNPPIGEVICADAVITGVPAHASLYTDSSIEDETHLGFHACDWDVTGDEGCRHGDEDDEIASVDAQVHLNQGSPDIPPFHAAPEGQHAMVLADLESEDDVALDASVSVEHIHAIEVDTTALGIEASTDLGDGVQPFALYGDVDLRHPSKPEGLRLVADAVVDPLPQELTLVQTATPEDEPESVLTVDATTTEPATLTSSFNAFGLANDDSVCGQDASLCADLVVERIPETLHAGYAISHEDLPGDGDPRLRFTDIDLTLTPHDGQAKPDIEASATIGANTFGLPLLTPLVAEARLEGLPGRLMVRLEELEREVPPPAGDWDVDAFGIPTLARQLQAIDVHTCEWDYDDQACADDTEGQLDLLEANARTFLLPPAGLPPLQSIAEQNYAVVNGRGSHYQGAVRFTDVREVRLLTRQLEGDDDTSGRLLGFFARAGGGGSFRVAADVEGFRIGEMSFLGATFDDAELAAEASVVLSNLPSEIGFCMRDGGITPIPDADGSSLTVNCEVEDPFAGFDPDDDLPDYDFDVDRTPMSVSFDSNATIADLNVTANVTIAEEADPDEALHIDGTLHIVDLPDEITAHILMPSAESDEQGPIVVRALVPQLPDTDLSITATAEIRFDDAVCYDPRPTAEVYCFAGTISDFPEQVDVFFDPTDPADNLLVRSIGGDPELPEDNLDVTGVRVDIQDGEGDVKVATAELIDLPSLLTGTLLLPNDPGDKPALDVVAEPPLGSATIEFQNFIAPDPFGDDAIPDGREDVPAAEQYVHLLQRDEFTRVAAHLESIASAGFRVLRDGFGQPLDTLVINAGFGTPGNIRAYADLRTPGGGDGPLAGTRLIADATLTDVPDEVSVCFRPSREDGTASSAEDNWCEDDVENGVGALQITQTHTTDPDALLDAYAFFRLASDAGDSILAASASITDLPPVVRAIVPTGGGGLAGGTIDIGGYENEDVDPAGPAAAIGTIDAEFATFDLPADGYTDTERTYTPRRLEVDPFPVPVENEDEQHLSAVIVDDNVHVDALLGPESPLERLQIVPRVCDLEEDGQPVDFPYYPDDGTDYQCVRIDLHDAEGPGDPLAVHFVRERNEQRMSLTDAGLTDLPPWIAITLATGAETTFDNPLIPEDNAPEEIPDDEETLRRPCGSAVVEDGGALGDCVAPMVRFDQPSAAVLYGSFTHGDRDALFRLAGLVPEEDGVVPDLVTPPGPNGEGWNGDWPDARGVRVTFGKVHQLGDSGDDARVGVVRANIRLDVPRSLTIDQFQQWQGRFTEGILPLTTNTSSDLRFRFAVRDGSGNVVEELGRVAGLLELGEDKQLLLGGAGANSMSGFPLPGDIGVSVFTRSSSITNQLGDGTIDEFVQINGRVSVDIDLGARFFKGDEEAAVQLAARADLYHLPGTSHIGPEEADDAPSFVVAIERRHDYSRPSAIPEEEEEEEPEDPCKPTKCTEITAVVSAEALFDFQPDADEPATRRLEVFINQGKRNGIQLNAFSDLAGSNPSYVSGAFVLRVEALSVHVHRGVYLVGSFTLDLGARATIPLLIDRVSSLTVRHNALSLTMESTGAGGGGVFVIDSPDFLNIPLPPDAEVAELIIDWLSIETWAIGIPVLMAHYLAPGTPVNLRFLNCLAGGLNFETGITHFNQTLSAWVVWPLDDPNIQFSGVFGPLGFLAKKLGPLFCFGNLVDVGTDRPAPNYVHPGHPVTTTSHAPGQPEPDPVEETAIGGRPDHEVVDGDVLELCGTHEFGTLVVNGTLHVDTDGNPQATVEDELGLRADCENFDLDDDGEISPEEMNYGTLTLVADEIIVGPDGRIEGLAGFEATQDGNGGGGHGGAGGDGSTGPGAGASVDLDPPYVPEPGQRGGHSGGQGGGALAIHTRLLTLHPDNNDDPDEDEPGTITVAGGTVGSADDCVDADGGSPAGGGGSGGGLVIGASRVVNNGVVSADGGDGSDSTLGGGGGGGGGGGVLEIRTPFWEGNDPTANGGAGGTNLCADEQGDDATDDGGPGDPFVFEIDESPWSTPLAPVDFWQRPKGLLVPVSAAVPAAQAPNGYQVVLCAVQRPGEEIDINLPLHDQLAEVMPDPGDVDGDHPCGTGTIIGSRSGTVEEVGYDPPDEVTNFDLGPNNIDAVNGLSSGMTGLWSNVVALPSDGYDCTIADPEGCTPLQALPPLPQVVLGIDEDMPDVDITDPDPGFEAASGVYLDFTVEGGAAFPLGTAIESTRCRNETGPTLPCTSGEWWSLTDGPGDKTVHVEVVDAAGNVGHAQVSGTVTETIPFVIGTINEAPASGWYTEPPDLGLAYPFIEEDDAADPPLHYSIDGGPERHCQTLSCEVPASVVEALGPGLHRFGYTGEDQWNRRLPRSVYMDDEDGQYLEFMTDYEPPTSQFDIIPVEPDGEDDWYVTDPWVVISALDQDQGSDVDRIMVEVDGGGYDEYTEPFQLGTGDHSVCWYSVDGAGNEEPFECRHDIRVDLAAAHGAPEVDGVFPPAPDGDDGWFVTVPAIGLDGFDDGAGSGAPTDGTPFRYRVDHGGYHPCADPCDVFALLYHGTNHHQVLWSTLDEAGNRSPERRIRFDVDITPPITTVVVGPMAPTGLNGWYIEQPWVQLSADDPGAMDGRSSGVASMTYSIDGGPDVDYDGPFLAPVGEHEICGWATDQAGNAGGADCETFDVDPIDPTIDFDEPAPDGGSGWHLDVTDVEALGADAGSGVDPAPLTTPCGHAPAHGNGPSGTCLAVDGGGYFLADAPVALSEGVHHLRAFSIDRAGRRSPVIDRTVLVDRSAPVTTARLFAAAPAAEGWYRSTVTVALTPVDGDRNSGVVLTEYQIDNGLWRNYSRPFTVGEGVHEVKFRSTDAAGRVEVIRRLPVNIDLTPTVVTALAPNPTIWIKLLGLLGPAQAQLRWRITENLADHVHVDVIIYDTLGDVVRRLDGGTHAVTPGVPLEGGTAWDGKDLTLLGLVPVGIYHYRVVATDEAGNTSQSGESRPIQIKLAVCLPFIGCL